MKTFSKIIGLTLCILVINSYSQDQNYTQFFNNKLYYNPGYAGLYNGVRTHFSYRNQWTKLPYDFKSYNVAFDISARGLPGGGGLGAIIHNDNEGEGMVRNFYGGLILASRIPLNKTRGRENLVLQFGITAALCQKKIDWAGLVFPDQLNGKYGNIYPTNFSEPENSNVVYPDFSFGSVLAHYSENVNTRIGGAIHHIFEPKIGFLNDESKLGMKFIAHGDVIIMLEEERKRDDIAKAAKLNTGILYENQNGANTFNIGVTGYKSHIYLGIWYRNEDINTLNLNSVIFLTGVNFSMGDDSRVRLMYSYDYITNKLIGTGGTHEISLILEFNNANVFKLTGAEKQKWGSMPCSEF